jgi:hypothetical protein
VLSIVALHQATDTDNDTLEDIVRNTVYDVLESVADSELGSIVNRCVSSIGGSNMLMVDGVDCVVADYRCLEISQHMYVLEI